MKNLCRATLAILFASSAAYADPTCVGLAAHVGVYKQISNTCGAIGEDKVSLQEYLVLKTALIPVDDGKTYPGFWLSHSDTPTHEIWADGDDSSPEDACQCVTEGNVFSARLPDAEGFFTYGFTEVGIEFTFAGYDVNCQAHYKKLTAD